MYVPGTAVCHWPCQCSSARTLQFELKLDWSREDRGVPLAVPVVFCPDLAAWNCRLTDRVKGT